jgi:Ring finger domain
MSAEAAALISFDEPHEISNKRRLQYMPRHKRRMSLRPGRRYATLSTTEMALCLLCLLLQMSLSHGFIYANNNTYDSLPALFGRFMVRVIRNEGLMSRLLLHWQVVGHTKWGILDSTVSCRLCVALFFLLIASFSLFGAQIDGKAYDARLQYFHSNPYLCELDDKTRSHFVPPVGPTIPAYGGGEFTLYGEPVVILAVRGNCPFQRKATIASSIHESIKFLLIANFNLDGTSEGEDLMVPMVSNFGDTDLVLLSISHATGQALKKFLSEQPDDTTSLGGPIVKMDSAPPMDIMTPEDLQSMLLSALGLFFMLLSVTGCLIILAGTYSQIAYMQDGSGPSDNPVAAVTQRRLLTEGEVQQLTRATLDVESSNSDAGDAATRPIVPRTPGSRFNGLGGDSDTELDEVDEDQCAICLGDFDESSLTALPCQHKFHTSCIAPWLTERQSKCPLCKFDVLQHIREQQRLRDESDRGDGFANGSTSIWDQFRRPYQWVRIAEHGGGHDASIQNGEDHGVELAGQRRTAA